MQTTPWLVRGCLVLAVSAQAATNTWDGGSTVDSNWSSAANWNADTAPVSGSDTYLKFDGGTRLGPAQDLASPFVLNRLDFLGGASYTAAFTIGGGQLQFVASGSTQPRLFLDRNATCGITNAIDIPAGVTLNAQIGTYGVDLRGPITGGGLIDKGEQAGGLSLYSSANTFSGGLIVRAQDNDWFKVNIYGSGAMGAGPVSLYGGTLATNRNSVGGLIFYNSTTQTNSMTLYKSSPIHTFGTVVLNGPLDAGAYSLHLRGSGAGTINGVIAGTCPFALVKSDGGTWTLGNANTFTGRVTLINGTLKLGTANALMPQVPLVLSCATSVVASATYATFDLNGRSQTVGLLSASATPNGQTNMVTSASPATLTVNQAASTVFNGFLTGAVGLAKAGAGALTLTNWPSTTTGDITVSGGTLTVAQGASLVNSTNVTVAGGTLDLQAASAIADSALVQIADGAKLTLSSAVTETVNKLIVGGMAKPRGYYGTSASVGAQYVDDVHFGGTGLLYVVNNPIINPTAVTWDAGGADLLMSTAANWVGDATPAFDGTNLAVFATGGVTATVDVAANLYGMSFNRDGAFTLMSGAGVISNGAGGIVASATNMTARTYTIVEDLVLSDNQTWYVGTNTGFTTLSVRGVVDDVFMPCNLVKSGAGVLNLTSSNTFDGTFTINDGDVNIYNSQALGNTNGNTVVNGGVGGRLCLNGNLVVSEPLVLNGEKNNNGTLIVGTGSNVVTGPLTCYSQVRIQGYNGPLVIAGGVTADNNGLFVVNSGTTITFKDKPLNLGARTFWSDSSGISVLAVSGNNWADTICAGGGIRCQVANAMPATAALGLGVGSYGPGGIFNLNGYNQTVGKLYIGASIPGVRVVTSDTPALLTVNQSADSIFDARFTGAVSLLKLGSGALTLTNAFTTTTGGFNVSSGTLAVAANGTFGPNCTNVVVAGTGTLILSNSVAIADSAVLSLPAANVSTAKVALGPGVNEAVGWLAYGSRLRRTGTYGSTLSAAANKDDTHFSGTGMLTVKHDNTGTLFSVK